MNKDQLDALTAIKNQPVTISVDDLGESALQPRTLVYGYTAERDTFHVWLTPTGHIARLIYSHDGSVLFRDVRSEWPVEDMIPNKRAYPEYSDFLFASIIKSRHERGISFRNWAEPKPFDGPYKGLI